MHLPNLTETCRTRGVCVCVYVRARVPGFTSKIEFCYRKQQVPIPKQDLEKPGLFLIIFDGIPSRRQVISPILSSQERVKFYQCYRLKWTLESTIWGCIDWQVNVILKSGLTSIKASLRLNFFSTISKLYLTSEKIVYSNSAGFLACFSAWEQKVVLHKCFTMHVWPGLVDLGDKSQANQPGRNTFASALLLIANVKGLAVKLKIQICLQVESLCKWRRYETYPFKLTDDPLILSARGTAGLGDSGGKVNRHPTFNKQPLEAVYLRHWAVCLRHMHNHTAASR